jgi:hypothetical protein
MYQSAMHNHAAACGATGWRERPCLPGCRRPKTRVLPQGVLSVLPAHQQLGRWPRAGLCNMQPLGALWQTLLLAGCGKEEQTYESLPLKLL